MKTKTILTASVFAVTALIILAVFASADGGSDRDAGIDPDLQELIDNVPAPDQQMPDKCREDPDVLAVSGKMPELKAGKDSYDYFVSLQNVRQKVTRDGILKEYMYPQGPVVGYGVRAEHYFTVTLYNENDDENGPDAETVDEIISVLTAVAAEEGISDMMIVVEKGEPLRFDDGTYTFTEEEKQIVRQENPDYQEEKGTPVVLTAPDGREEIIYIIGFAALFRPSDEKTLIEFGVSDTTGYEAEYGPIVGGIAHNIAVDLRRFTAGTTGFAARNTTTGETGYVTAGHLTLRKTGLSSYRPDMTASAAAGKVSLIGADTDAAFVPYPDVTGKIHIGNGTLVDVTGSVEGGMPGMTLSRSGRMSGNVSGMYVGSFTNVTSDGRLLENIEAMTGTCYSGDSGGPVYDRSGSGCRIVGITSMPGTVGDQDVTIYIPYSEISSKLGIEALNG